MFSGVIFPEKPFALFLHDSSRDVKNTAGMIKRSIPVFFTIALFFCVWFHYAMKFQVCAEKNNAFI